MATCAIPFRLTAVMKVPDLTPLLWLYFGKMATALAILLVFWLLGVVVQSLFDRVASRRQKRQSAVLRLGGKLSHAGCLVIGVVTALGTVGVNVSAMVASLGLTGFALGFAFKDALSNVLAGVLILIYQPFQEGDQIKAGDADGEVAEIDLRYTTVRGDGCRFLVPNSVLISSTVTVSERAEDAA